MSKKSNRLSEDERSRINLAEVIGALREERAAIDRLIEAIELLTANQAKGMGRTAIRLREAKRSGDSAKVIVFAARDVA
jgi:hypothetical protein